MKYFEMKTWKKPMLFLTRWGQGCRSRSTVLSQLFFVLNPATGSWLLALSHSDKLHLRLLLYLLFAGANALQSNPFLTPGNKPWQPTPCHDSDISLEKKEGHTCKVHCFYEHSCYRLLSFLSRNEHGLESVNISIWYMLAMFLPSLPLNGNLTCSDPKVTL